MGSLCFRVIQHVGSGFHPPSHLSTHWQWILCAFVSFDTLAVGSVGLRVVRHVGGGFSPISRPSIRWRWVVSAFRAFGFLVPRVFRHMNDGCVRSRWVAHWLGFHALPCHSTRRCWVPSTSTSFNTLVPGSMHLRIVRQIGDGLHVLPRRSTVGDVFYAALCRSTHW